MDCRRADRLASRSAAMAPRCWRAEPRLSRRSIGVLPVEESLGQGDALLGGRDRRRSVAALVLGARQRIVGLDQEQPGTAIVFQLPDQFLDSRMPASIRALRYSRVSSVIWVLSPLP